MKRLFSLSVVLLTLFAGSVFAKPLDVEVILDLLDAGISEDSIQRFVERNQYTVQLTAGDLVDLKKAGASDELIAFLQETEGASSAQAEGETQTSPSGSYESDEAVNAVEYSSPDVYFGFGVGIGFGYPYYYSPYYYPGYYYPGYYYPAYPIYSPYPCGNVNYPGYYPGGTSGTGVYSYWYRNQTGPKPRPVNGVGGSTTTNLSGRVLRSAPSPGAAPQVSGGRNSTVTSRQSVSTHPRPSRYGNAGVHGSSQGGTPPRGGGTSGMRGSQGGATRSSGSSVRGSQGGASRSGGGGSSVRSSQGSASRSGGGSARGSQGTISRGGGMGGSRSFHGGGGSRGGGMSGSRSGGGGFRGGGSRGGHR
jgi:hypothetical protein